MIELSERARRVLELARHEDDPDAGAAERVERSLSKRMALGAALAAGSATVSKSAAGAGLMATAAKSALVVGVAASLAFGGWEMLSPQPPARDARPPLTVAAPRTRDEQEPGTGLPPLRAKVASPAPSAQPPLPMSVPERLPPRRVVAARTGYPRDQSEPVAVAAAEAPPRALPRAAPDRLSIEAQELRGAQQALRAGDNERALALLELQDARHASGALAQERHAARVLALCQSQQVTQARREAESFAARFPKSPLLGKVRGACRGR